MNKFSFADYIFRQAYPQHSGDRGIAEVKAMNEATRDSENSNNAISEFNNKFSLRAMRDLTVGTDSAGGFNVADKVTAPAFQNFYSESFFMKYATVLSGLRSNVTINSKSSPVTLTESGVEETTTAANTFSQEPTFQNIKLQPHHIRVSIELSQTLIFQSSQSLGDLILNEIRAALAEELDRQIIHGDSSDDEISGIVNTSGISSDVIGVLSSLTPPNAHGFVVGAEKSLGSNKAPLPYMWILNSATREKLRESKSPAGNNPIFSDDSTILGYDTFVTENLDDSDIHLISPGFVVLALFHEDDMIDLIVDGWTKFGKVILTVSVMADCALVNPNALYVLSKS